MSTGELVLGLRGQSICDHFTFCAAFATAEEFRVLHGEREIGSLPATLLPPPGEFVLLAGRRWRVERIDGERREVHVVPGSGRKKPSFGSIAADLHPRVHAKMRDLACTERVPAYLDEGARKVLATVRETAVLSGHFQPKLRAVGDRTRLFLWAGTKAQRTVYLALREAGLELQDEQVGLDVEAPVGEVRAALAALRDTPPDPQVLAARAARELGARDCGADKFDWALPDALWAAAYARDRLRVEAAVFDVEQAANAPRRGRGHLARS